MKNFKNINKALGVNRLESLNGTVDLNIDQVATLNNALKPANNAKKEIATAKAQTAATKNRISQLQQQATKIQEEKAAKEKEMERFIAALDSIHPLVAAQKTIEEKEKTVRAMLAAKPGTFITGPQNEQSTEAEYKKRGFSDANWKFIDSLPHNIEVDRNFASKY